MKRSERENLLKLGDSCTRYNQGFLISLHSMQNKFCKGEVGGSLVRLLQGYYWYLSLGLSAGMAV